MGALGKFMAKYGNEAKSVLGNAGRKAGKFAIEHPKTATGGAAVGLGAGALAHHAMEDDDSLEGILNRGKKKLGEFGDDARERLGEFGDDAEEGIHGLLKRLGLG